MTLMVIRLCWTNIRKMKYYSVSIKEIVNASREQFWNVLANRFGEISQLSNGVKDSKYISDQKEGVGTTRHCVFPNKGFAKEEVTIWEEPEEFEFQILDTSMPMEKGGKLNFKLKPISGEQSEVNVFGTFRLKKMAFLSPLLKPILKKIIRQMISDIEFEAIK